METGARRELLRLWARPPPGVRLAAPDDREELSTVRAELCGPAETPYAGGVFTVRLQLSREYPAAAPRAVFETRVWHPNVSWVGGEVCVSTLSRDWRPELGLAHCLAALRCLLIAPNADSALNAEAAAQFRDDYATYAARARLHTDIHARAHAQEGGGGVVRGGRRGGGGGGGAVVRRRTLRRL